MVRPEDGLIVGGHQRLLVYRELLRREGLSPEAIETTEVPVVLLPVGTSDIDAKRLNLALNKIQGEWDYGLLNTLLQDLRVELADIQAFEVTGFTALEVDDIKATMGVDAMPPAVRGGHGGPQGMGEPPADPAGDAAAVGAVVDAALAAAKSRWVVEFTTLEDAEEAGRYLLPYGYAVDDPTSLPGAILGALRVLGGTGVGDGTDAPAKSQGKATKGKRRK